MVPSFDCSQRQELIATVYVRHLLLEGTRPSDSSSTGEQKYAEELKGKP
jgi:hypothetical protein